jgi:hypothetical protein
MLADFKAKLEPTSTPELASALELTVHAGFKAESVNINWTTLMQNPA